MHPKQYTQEDIDECLKQLDSCKPGEFVNLRNHLQMFKKQLNKNPPVRYSFLPLHSCFNNRERKYSLSWLSPIIKQLGISRLNLSRNKLSLREIAEFISLHLEQLKSIDLRLNDLGDDGDLSESNEDWQRFKSLLASSKITQLEVQGNEFSSSQMEELTNIIKNNKVKGGTEFIEPEKSDVHIEEAHNKLLNANNLATILSEQFCVDACTEEDSISSRLYLVSNELRYRKVIKILKDIKVPPSNQIRVGLLVGESNILSLLPHLAGICDLVLMADIEPRVATHNRHVIDCMLKTKKPAEFLHLYTENHPLENTRINLDGSKIRCSSTLLKNLIAGEPLGGRFGSGHTVQKESLGEFFFLNSSDAFMQCKHALLALPLRQIKLDMSNEHECSAFAKVLQMNQARITFCNLSNLHYPISVEKLRTTVPILLAGDLDGCKIMFSEHAVERSSSLHTTLTEGIDNYLQAIEQNKLIPLKKPFLAKNSCSFNLNLFAPPSKSEQNKKPQICYVGFYDPHNITETKFIQKVINGVKNINDYSYMLRVMLESGVWEK